MAMGSSKDAKKRTRKPASVAEKASRSRMHAKVAGDKQKSYAKVVFCKKFHLDQVKMSDPKCVTMPTVCRNAPGGAFRKKRPVPESRNFLERRSHVAVHDVLVVRCTVRHGKSWLFTP